MQRKVGNSRALHLKSVSCPRRPLNRNLRGDNYASRIINYVKGRARVCAYAIQERKPEPSRRSLAIGLGGWLGSEMVYVKGTAVEAVEKLAKKVEESSCRRVS